MFCAKMSFHKLNSSIMQLTYEEFSGQYYQWSNSTNNMEITDDPAIFIYAGIPFTISYYSRQGEGEVAILAANWTADYYKAQYFIYGLARNTEDAVDLREFAMKYGLPTIYNRSFRYFNNGCYYSGVSKAPGYNTTSIIRNWNILAAYDTFEYFPWANVTKSHTIFQRSKSHYYNMTITGINNSTKDSIVYGVTLLPEPKTDGVLWGLSLQKPTSLIVNYVYNPNNIIVISGDQTFGMVLSANQTTITPTQLITFQLQLVRLKSYNPKAVYVLQN